MAIGGRQRRVIPPLSFIFGRSLSVGHITKSLFAPRGRYTPNEAAKFSDTGLESQRDRHPSHELLVNTGDIFGIIAKSSRVNEGGSHGNPVVHGIIEAKAYLSVVKVAVAANGIITLLVVAHQSPEAQAKTFFQTKRMADGSGVEKTGFSASS
jgi:hypothetical protein